MLLFVVGVDFCLFPSSVHLPFPVCLLRYLLRLFGVWFFSSVRLIFVSVLLPHATVHTLWWRVEQDGTRRGVVWCVRFNWCVRLGVKTAQIVLLARRPALQVHCKQRGGAMREHAIHLRCDTGGCLAEQQALLLETPVQSLHVSCLCQGSCGQAERRANGRVGDVSELRTQEVSCVSECVCA